MHILGVRIDEVSREQAKSNAGEFLLSNRGNTIFTPNPEMLVAAHRLPAFRDVLNTGNLNVCDGKGVELVSYGKLERIPGIDFMLDICAIAQEKCQSIFLLGSGSQDVVEKTREELLKRFPQLNIIGMHKGGTYLLSPCLAGRRAISNLISYDTIENEEVLDSVIDVAPQIIFVAFGHVKQECWIVENLPHLPSVKIAMGVGGAFDYISGRVSRAPRLLRAIGLEWVWRLATQPKRLKRIWTAVVVFPLYCLLFGKK